LTTDRPIKCPERCRKAAEDSAREACDGEAPKFLAWLDEMKPIAEASRRTSQLTWSGARIYAPAWNLLRDFSAKEAALRDGEPERIVWQATYAKSTRARRQRAINNLRRAGDARHRSRFQRFLVEAIATRVKEIRGKWPSYSSASGYGGKDVLRIEDWLNYLFCPRHPKLAVSSEGIVKCLKALRRGQPPSPRDLLSGRLRMWVVEQLLRISEADLADVQRTTGERSDDLRAIRAARRRLSPLMRKILGAVR